MVSGSLGVSRIFPVLHIHYIEMYLLGQFLYSLGKRSSCSFLHEMASSLFEKYLERLIPFTVIYAEYPFLFLNTPIVPDVFLVDLLLNALR